MSQPETLAVPVAPEPEFQVLGATGRRHAAVPALDFDVHVTEPGGRQVHAIALSAQIMIEPARRTYDAETREKLVELFGPPERWATTTRSLVWHQADVLVPAFVGAKTFRVAVPASFDMRRPPPSTSTPARRRSSRWRSTRRHGPLRGDDGRLQMSLVPWSCSAEFRMPVSTWRELIEHYYPRSGYRAPRADAPGTPAREGAPRPADPRRVRVGAARLVNELVGRCCTRATRSTPTRPVRRRTPLPLRSGSSTRPRTRGRSTTYDHLELQCVVEGDLRVSSEVHFLLPSGERHVAEAQRIEGVGDFDRGSTRTYGARGGAARGWPLARLISSRTARSAGRAEPGEALRYSLISTHPVLRADGGRFMSQLDAPCESVNTWPVLASPDDDLMLGAAIILPDHPQSLPRAAATSSTTPRSRRRSCCTCRR